MTTAAVLSHSHTLRPRLSHRGPRRGGCSWRLINKRTLGLASAASSQYSVPQERSASSVPTPPENRAKKRSTFSLTAGDISGGSLHARLLRDAPDAAIFILTFNLPPLSSSLIFSRASTVLLRSLCMRRPKSLNMVEPPESTMF
ncbi:hypothetical protein EYF80_039068 [Liparis tanakae]|uniref:Uncharacterized protein n=1 Tax=Liparis tanakae TaxID=230148 RepID=A0A4Z2GAX1_9TELE|nr:hypothetical protein EYF80_039068 [Liparis tanakae]